MEFRTVALLGAGAVGAYVIWGLSQKTDVSLCVVADGERRERYLRDGFVINGKSYFPAVKTPEEAHGADLLIVCLKSGALYGSLGDIKKIVGENTTVMSLMNGVESEEIIASAVGEEKIVYSLIKVASERKGASSVFVPENTIGLIYGEKDAEHSPFGHERTDALDRLFSDCGMRYRQTDHILPEMWVKFRLNVTCNQPQAMVGCGVGAYTDSEHVKFLHDRLKDEVEAVAKAKGIDLTLADSSSNRGSKVDKRARYSTLQDLDAKRHTEVDTFAGAVVRMGRELGIPTPYSEFTYHMIKALEEKNDGLFDYTAAAPSASM